MDWSAILVLVTAGGIIVSLAVAAFYANRAGRDAEKNITETSALESERATNEKYQAAAKIDAEPRGNVIDIVNRL